MPEKTSLTVSTPVPDFAAFVGLDWGDEKHALSLCAVCGPIERIFPHRAWRNRRAA